MSDLAKSILRDFVQKVLGVVFAWVGVHFIAIPSADKDAITNWAVLAVISVALLIWTSAVRWLESRKGTGQLDVACRALGRILMFGIKTTPQYTDTTPLPPASPIVVELPPPSTTLGSSGTINFNAN